MPDRPTEEMPSTENPPPIPRLRRVRSERGRTERMSTGSLIKMGGALVVLFLIYQFFFSGPGKTTSDVVDFSQSTQQIEELSTVKSHYRFTVVVREESGNIIVRRLADQTEYIGMDQLSTVLFQDPTMFVELHGVATYGVRLGDLSKRIRQDDTVVHISVPRAEVLDVKLVAADTRIVAQMKGLFRSSNNTLLLEANRHGEEFVRQYAVEDSTIVQLSEIRVRNILGLLVERSGKRALFE